jgi:monoterpene epsilon-lactone hydrolase
MRSLQSYFFWALLRLYGLISIPRPPLEQTRKNMERRSRLLPLPPCTAIRGVHVEGLLAEWVIPPGNSARGVMLYLHGGAFSMGSRRTHRAFVARLAAASHIQALSIDYRLAPEHPFPAGLEDVLTAYR